MPGRKTGCSTGLSRRFSLGSNTPRRKSGGVNKVSIKSTKKRSTGSRNYLKNLKRRSS